MVESGLFTFLSRLAQAYVWNKGFLPILCSKVFEFQLNSSRNVMSSVLYPLSAVLPVNIPLDVRVSCSECPVRAGENRQCGGPGSCEMMWAQFWLDQLSKDTGTGCAGAGGCGCLCSIASPAPATGEWMGLWALGSAWVPPTLAKKDPISQVNISGHTLQSAVHCGRDRPLTLPKFI